jgi:hypothetical protein
MSSISSDRQVTFVTVTDYDFFPGTLATVNSILKFHPHVDVVVVNNLKKGLSEPQRMLLERGGIKIIDSTMFEKGERFIGPWELKAYAACDLAESYDMIIGIDSDCVLCSGVDDVIEQSFATGKFTGGKDGHGPLYDETYAGYGITVGSHNSQYMSTSLFFCPTTERNKAILRRWAECTNEALYNSTGSLPGHGDQGLLNAVIFSELGTEGTDLLENMVWSQHWTYWNSIVAYDDGEFRNYSQSKERQRTFHCGGAEKFWEKSHSDRILEVNQSQSTNYAWWQYLFWFGLCQDFSIDPYQYIPPKFHHLCVDLVNYFPQMRKFDDRITLWDGESTGLLTRLVDNIRGCMNFNGSMEDYLEIVRTLPEGAKIVEVGSCEGRSIVSLALACLDRNYTFYSVESFTGDLNGTFDGCELPSIRRYIQNVKYRYPFLPINCVFERSADASRLFANDSLDAVFIDAGHSEAAVRKDIEAWLPKIKNTGTLFGDDWLFDSVKKGVLAEFAPELVSDSLNGYLWSVKKDDSTFREDHSQASQEPDVRERSFAKEA